MYDTRVTTKPKKDTKVKLENLSSKSPVVSPVLNSVLTNKKELAELPKADSRDILLSGKTTPVVSKDNVKEGDGAVVAKEPEMVKATKDKEKDHSESASVSNYGEFPFQSLFFYLITT